jgi:hypothetical protein
MLAQGYFADGNILFYSLPIRKLGPLLFTNSSTAVVFWKVGFDV